MIVVGVASFMTGLGSLLWWILRDFGIGQVGDVFWRSFILGSLFEVGAWLLWVYVAYQVLARYGTRVDFYEMVRSMGFAFAPMGLMLLMLITPLGLPIALIALIVTVLFTNVAIQSATTAESHQVIAANVAGFAIFALVMGILANIAQVDTLGGLAPGIFFFNLAP